MKKAHESINPGEILLTESLEPLGVDDRFWSTSRSTTTSKSPAIFTPRQSPR